MVPTSAAGLFGLDTSIVARRLPSFSRAVTIWALSGESAALPQVTVTPERSSRLIRSGPAAVSSATSRTSGSGRAAATVPTSRSSGWLPGSASAWTAPGGADGTRSNATPAASTSRKSLPCRTASTACRSVTVTTRVLGHCRVTDAAWTAGIRVARSAMPCTSCRANGVPSGTAAAAITLSAATWR